MLLPFFLGRKKASQTNGDERRRKEMKEASSHDKGYVHRKGTQNYECLPKLTRVARSTKCILLAAPLPLWDFFLPLAHVVSSSALSHLRQNRRKKGGGGGGGFGTFFVTTYGRCGGRRLVGSNNAAFVRIVVIWTSLSR